MILLNDFWWSVFWKLILCFENWFSFWNLFWELTCVSNWFEFSKGDFCFENWFESICTWFGSVSHPRICVCTVIYLMVKSVPRCCRMVSLDCQVSICTWLPLLSTDLISVKLWHLFKYCMYVLYKHIMWYEHACLVTTHCMQLVIAKADRDLAKARSIT